MAWVAVSGSLMGVLVGWYISRQSRSTSPPSPAPQQQINQIREIDRLVSSAMASLRTYEKRILSGKHLGPNGSASTKAVASGARGGGQPSLSSNRMPLRQPLDGKTLLAVKREANENIQECTHALARASAVLEEETVLHAQDLVDSLVATRETLEKQEAADEVATDALDLHVSAVYRSRTRFLSAARKRLGVDPLSEETKEGIETLTQQAFSPSQLPRPFVAEGIRPTE